MSHRANARARLASTLADAARALPRADRIEFRASRSIYCLRLTLWLKDGKQPTDSAPNSAA